MSEDFPSGEWTGFYNYRPGDRHRMDLQLSFSNGLIAGTGNDDVGAFVVKGTYDSANRACSWRKRYMAAHTVFYRGFREGKGIWGTWEVEVLNHGGFHIWPKAAGEQVERKESVEAIEPEDAIATIAAEEVS